MSALARIFETKRREVEEAKTRVSLAEIKARAEDAPPLRGFKSALERATPRMALIAEVKKASPSKGVIRDDFDPAEISRVYETCGAHALSVLTDETYFLGSLENLRAARSSAQLPVLRKDFICDPYQIYEARAWGADAILLIVASLSIEEMIEFRSLAAELGMDSLVEVHTEEEADAALQAKCDLIGVNNRDLLTFETSLEVSERILPRIAPTAFPVSESALESREDVERVRAAGARAVLIGTGFCAAPDIAAKVREVMG